MVFRHRFWKKGFPLILIAALITQTFPMKVVRAEEAGSCICSCEQCSCDNEEKEEIIRDDLTEGNEICACNEAELNQGCVRCGEGCTCCLMNAGTENSVCSHQHDGTCGYAEALSEVPCDMDCKDTDGDGMIKHCQGCSYMPAVEGKPCMHVHDEYCGFYMEETVIQPEEMTEEDTENMSELSTEQVLNDVEEVTEDERKTIEETNGNSNTDSEEETEAEKCLETEKCTETESDVQEAGSTKEKSKVPEKDSAQHETEVRNEAKALKPKTDKVITQESDKEKAESSNEINSPYYTIKIPSEVMINESTDFEIITSFVKDMENKKAYLVIDGDWAEDGTDCFALRCSECSDVTVNYKIFIGGTLITKEHNRVELSNSIETQRLKIVSINGMNQVPAGSYQGNIYFNISYK